MSKLLCCVKNLSCFFLRLQTTKREISFFQLQRTLVSGGPSLATIAPGCGMREKCFSWFDTPAQWQLVAACGGHLHRTCLLGTARQIASASGMSWRIYFIVHRCHISCMPSTPWASPLQCASSCSRSLPLWCDRELESGDLCAWHDWCRGGPVCEQG